MGWRNFRDRLSLIILFLCFGFIGLDAWGAIDIGKFGYAAFGTWIGLVINFYYRKKGEGEEIPPTGGGGT